MKTLTYEKIIEDLPPVLSDKDVIALDIELSGLNPDQMHRPAGNFLSLQGSFDGKTAYIIYDDSQIQEFLNKVSAATWVFHNATFDLGHLRRWATIPERKNLRDTLLIEKLMFSNYYDSFSLADLVRRYLGAFLSKDTREEFIKHSGRMTREQIEYAALDPIATWLVDKEQQKIISELDKKIWNSVYNPHIWTVLELGGFSLNRDEWIALAVEQKAIADKIESELGQKYGHSETKEYKRRPSITKFVPFNPASPSQVVKLLNSIGIQETSSDDKVIRGYSEQYPIVKQILEYRKAQKKVSTYGFEFLKNVEADGKIYTSLNISEAETGRDSSSSPNLQNILSDEKYRKCFIAGYGKKLVIYDYSGQEANIFAYNTQDPKLIDIINSGKKLYIEVALEAFGEVVIKDSPRYKKVKSLVLGLMYGLSPYGYAIQEDIPIEDAEDDFSRFFEAFPVTATWVKRMQSPTSDVSKTILGRTIHLHPYDWQRRTNALNNPQQGTAGDMIKLAMKAFRYSNLYKKNHPLGRLNLVLQIHDEIVAECDTEIAEETKKELAHCMDTVAEKLHPGIISRASGGICDTWAEKERAK